MDPSREREVEQAPVTTEPRRPPPPRPRRSAPLTAARIAALQRNAGNAAVARLLRGRPPAPPSHRRGASATPLARLTTADASATESLLEGAAGAGAAGGGAAELLARPVPARREPLVLRARRVPARARARRARARRRRSCWARPVAALQVRREPPVLRARARRRRSCWALLVLVRRVRRGPLVLRARRVAARRARLRRSCWALLVLVRRVRRGPLVLRARRVAGRRERPKRSCSRRQARPDRAGPPAPQVAARLARLPTFLAPRRAPRLPVAVPRAPQARLVRRRQAGRRRVRVAARARLGRPRRGRRAPRARRVRRSLGPRARLVRRWLVPSRPVPGAGRRAAAGGVSGAAEARQRAPLIRCRRGRVGR